MIIIQILEGLKLELRNVMKFKEKVKEIGKERC